MKNVFAMSFYCNNSPARGDCPRVAEMTEPRECMAIDSQHPAGAFRLCHLTHNQTN